MGKRNLEFKVMHSTDAQPEYPQMAWSASKEMRNNIASFEKTSCSRVKIMEKINAESISALNFAQNIT